MTDIKIDEYKVKVTGTVNVPRPLEHGKTYDLTISNAEVSGGGERIPNEDGTYNEIWKVKVGVASELGIIGSQDVMIGKKKNFSQSQALRIIIEDNWDGVGDCKAWYQKRMSEIIENEKNKY